MNLCLPNLEMTVSTHSNLSCGSIKLHYIVWFRGNKTCLGLLVDTEGTGNTTTVTTPACFPPPENPEEQSITQDF